MYRVLVLNNCDCKHYVVNEKNRITSYWYDCKDNKMHRHTFSGNWVLVGFVRKEKFGRLSAIISPDEICDLPYFDYYFKNGKLKYFAVWRDHGSTMINMTGIENFYSHADLKFAEDI